jgi:hypothetical protein
MRERRLIYWSRPRAGILLGHECGLVFQREPKISDNTYLGDVLGASMEML